MADPLGLNKAHLDPTQKETAQYLSRCYNSGISPMAPEVYDSIEGIEVYSEVGSGGTQSCPGCGHLLKDYMYNEDYDETRIVKCPKCKEIWMYTLCASDAGTWEQFIRLSKRSKLEKGWHKPTRLQRD